MYQTILKKFSEDGIHLNDEQANFLRIFEKNLPRKSFFVDFFKEKSKKGCYVHGNVGRGKTMMLNAIFKEIKFTKCSYHFIEFMKFIHKELELVKNTKDPLEKIAKRIASKHRVLFIDEFQVEDVSDAMIIGKLLNLLSKMNVFIMLTSNAKIENLYKNGLQRDKFIRHISQLEESFVVYEFIGDKDYRLKNINLNSSKNGKDFSQGQIFDFIKKNFNFIGDLNEDLEINDRTFRCKGNTKDFIWLSYKEFFRQNLAISDFLAICKNYDWFFIDDFEQNDDYGKDIIRRFIGFIDIAYIEKVKIKFFMNNDDIRSLYSGEELSFLWDRTISRIEEMRDINDK
jgi:cell division protein ZapE